MNSLLRYEQVNNTTVTPTASSTGIFSVLGGPAYIELVLVIKTALTKVLLDFKYFMY